MDLSSSASRRAAWRSRERTRYWCGVTPSTLENSRRKWNGLMPACAAACSRSICRCECASIHSAVSTARRRSRAAVRTGWRGRPETTPTKRQAFVAADVIVGTDIFVAGMADQDRSRHQLEEAAARAAAEAALAHIGDRVAAVPLHERRIVRPGAAAEVGHRDGLLLQKRGCGHAAILALRARRSNRKQHVEQGLAEGHVRALDRKQPALGDRAAV